MTPPAPDPAPDPAPQREPIEGKGTITGLGEGFLLIDGVTVRFDETTEIKLNDVAAPAVGMAVQYKGIEDAAGVVTATDLEIN